MRILVYCQHVLGIGHLVRTFEILKALKEHQVTLMLGGARTEIPVPGHVTTVQLPPLMMDSTFSTISAEDDTPLEEVKSERISRIQSTCRQTQPEILLIELYPFGRNGFHFELEPLLKLVKKEFPSCLVASSVRDILVERDNQAKFERRVIDRLNRFFDLLLVHSDPEVIRLDETFSAMADISVPVKYTGYINRPPKTNPFDSHAAPKDPLKKPLIIASAGGGSVGYDLLEATVRAHRLLPAPCFLNLYTGPYLRKEQRKKLRTLAGANAVIREFCNDLPSELAGADLSVSMGGYNTTMDVISAGCPSLIRPFDQNHEQRLRAERLQPHTAITLLEQGDLEPERLAHLMETALNKGVQKTNLRLAGARETARCLVGAALRKQQKT